MPERRYRATRIVLTLATLVGVLTGCLSRPVGQLKTESKRIDLEGATSASVEIHMGLGELKIDDGAAGLMDAAFTYNIAEWQPQVAYTVDGGVGKLVIRQPQWRDNVTEDEIRYEWTLYFNEDIPLNLDINMGACESDLHLGGLSVKGLDIQTGAGEATVDLVGNWTDDVDVLVRGDLGKITLYLPQHVGVRVEVQGGFGAIRADDFARDGEAYVNAAYGESEATLEITIEAGLGEIELNLGQRNP
jgi:hypothetical protein